MKLKLLLSATRSSWQPMAYHGTEQDTSEAMSKARAKVLERDKDTCQCCGFKAKKWQEIHHINDDHSDYALKNLATVCSFCHQDFHLGLAGSTSGGILIWLPEMSQIELNHLSRALFVAMRDEKNKIANSASSLYMSLESRSGFLEQNFAPGASDPGILGQAFLKMKPAEYEQRDGFLKNIRLLPRRSRFGPQVKYWAETVFRDLPPESWERLIDKNKIEGSEEIQNPEAIIAPESGGIEKSSEE